MKYNKFAFFNFTGLKELKNKFNLFLLMFCSFVGVGFVSGAEIYEFFLRFGISFWLGIILFFVLVQITVYKMIVISKLEINSSKNANNLVLKDKNYKINDKNSKKLKFDLLRVKIREFVFGVNVFVISGAMFSGLKYFLKNVFNDNFSIIYFISLVCVFLILLFGVKLLSKFDYLVLVFVLALFLFYLFTLNDNFLNDFGEFSVKNAVFSLFFAALYVFMNMFQMKPLIDVSSATFTSKKDCRIFSLMFSIILTILLVVFALTLKNNGEIITSAMPFLELFKSKGGVLKLIFYFGLVIAIISTLVSSLIGLKNKIKPFLNWNNAILTLFSFIVCFIFGFVPFSVFVSIFYPLLGLVNFIAFVFC